MTDQEFGTEIKAARERKGWLQKDLGRRIHRTAPYTCSMEKGHTPPTRDDVRVMNRVFDDWAFLLAVTRYHTEDIVGTRFEALDGGRAGALICMTGEFAELQKLIAEAQVLFMRQPDQGNRAMAEEIAVNLLEARGSINEMMVRICGDYQLSALAMAKMRNARALEKGYVQKKNRHRQMAA